MIVKAIQEVLAEPVADVRPSPSDAGWGLAPSRRSFGHVFRSSIVALIGCCSPSGHASRSPAVVELTRSLSGPARRPPGGPVDLCRRIKHRGGCHLAMTKVAGADAEAGETELSGPADERTPARAAPPRRERGKTVHGEPANAGHRVLAPDDAEVEAYLETALHAPAPDRAARRDDDRRPGRSRCSTSGASSRSSSPAGSASSTSTPSCCRTTPR